MVRSRTRSQLLFVTCIVLMFSVSVVAEVTLAPVDPEYKAWEEEFGEDCISCKPEPRSYNGKSLGLIPQEVPFTTIASVKRDTRALPSSYDLRTANGSNYVSTVKNQTTCGACWSFATLASMESALMKQGQGEFDYSENNLKNNHGWSNGPCAGGHTQMSMAYLTRFDGPKLESDEPYFAGDDRPSPISQTHRYTTDVEMFAGNDEIKQAVIDHGALYTTMSWQDAGYNAGNQTFYYPSKVTINHAVTVVGWDDSKVTGAPNPGAWLIKNSWGAGWGDGGYFWIAYEDQSSVFDAHAFSKSVSNKFYSNNYYYDTLGNNTAINAKYGANLFTAKATEDLAAVGIYARADFTSYEIRIYDNYSNGEFYTQLGTTVTGTAENAGYYTIPLNEKIRLTAGDDFAVVVKFSNSLESYILPIEYPSGSTPAKAQSGQSFFSGSSITQGYTDITQQFPNTSICIKALTQSIDNEVPVLNSVTNQTIAEDTPLEVTMAMVSASDGDNDPLSIVISNGDNYSVSGTTITPSLNFHGTLTVPVRVTDAMSFSNTVNMTVAVTPVNDVPLITAVPNQETPEDYSIQLLLNMISTFDADGDALTLIVMDGANYTVSGTTVSPDLNFYGNLTVPIKVFDGTAYSATHYMTVEVRAVNDAPYINGHGEVILDEDQIFKFSIKSLNLHAFDPDNHEDDLEVVCENGDHYVIDGKQILLEADYNGYITIPVKVTDGELTSGLYNVTIKIRNVNDLPLFTKIFDQTTPEDTPLTLSMTMAEVIDIDGDKLHIVVDKGENYTVQDSIITPDPNFNGELIVPIRIADEEDTTLTINMTVTVTGINDAPVLLDIPDMTIQEDKTLTLSQSNLPVTDVDNEILTMTLGTGENYTLSGATIIPTANWSGTLTIPVSFSDGAISTPTKTLTVNVTPVNDLPVTAVTVQDMVVEQFEDCYMQVPVNPFTDIEDGILPVSYVSGLPDGLQYNGSVIMGEPLEAGNFDIALVGEDSDGGEAAITFRLSVLQKEATVKELLTGDAQALAVAPIPVLRGDRVTIYPDRDLYGEAKLYIFDPLGNQLFYRELSLPGDDEIDWNLTNNRGYVVASGTYIAVLEVENEDGSYELYRTRIGVRN